MTTATQQPHLDVNRRHDFVLFFDVADGNPNGDPDAGNLPRLDPETMQGLVTDVAIKRKVRDFVDIAHGDGRFKVYVQHGKFLSDQRKRVFGERAGGDSKPDPREAQGWMCEEFYDVRMFGAVMSMTEHNAGQVRGPVQLTFARSIDPIVPLDSAIVGPAQNERDVNREGAQDQSTNYGTMGRKSTIPYGLYRAHGFFNAHFAEQTGADAEDLALFWQALQMMWDVDRSSARGMMACRGLYVFSHESRLGNAPAASLLDRIAVHRREGIEIARRWADYEVSINEEALPAGIELTRLV